MVHAGQEVLIKDALVFLFAAGVVIPILRVFKLPTIAGFIVAGIALGPSGLGHFAEAIPILSYVSISDTAGVAPFAELGVLFLLFLLGLELSVDKLWALRRVVFGAGTMQVVLSAAAIAGGAYVLGLTPAAAIIIGLALALSSTAIIMQLLSDQRQVATPLGRSVLGVLLLQDILVAPILIFVGFASQGSQDEIGLVLLEALVEGLAALAIIYVIGRFLLRPAFQLAVAAGGRDLLLAIVLLTVVGAALITASAGLSIALGAFLAGLLVGETEFKHQTEVDLEPFKGLLLGLFFMTVGFGLELDLILAQWPLVLTGVAALLGVKLIIAWGALRIFVGGPALATQGAFLLAPAGEFAFVVLAAASLSGVVAASDISLITAIVGITMLLIPVSRHISRGLTDRFEQTTPLTSLPLDYVGHDGHVLIAGFGRVGQTIARILETENADILALDASPPTVSQARDSGHRVYLGDASRAEILAHVGIDGAAMMVVTVDDPDAAERIVRAVRQTRSDILILARARDIDHAARLQEAGASHVVPDAIEAGLQMAVRALEDVGYDTEAARDRVAAVRTSAYSQALDS